MPNSSPLVIDGLMDGAECKVLTITGKVLRTLNASNRGINGYQAFWDGKDEQGRWAVSYTHLTLPTILLV